MSVMTASRTELPDDRPLTVEDLDLLPDDGIKYELDDGVLVMSPAPGISHQFVVTNLAAALIGEAPPEFIVLAGPGVQISQVQYRIPDLVVARAGTVSFSDAAFIEPPELAVEVASPSTVLYDRNRKKEIYAEFGIGSYWIVTPSLDEPRLVAYNLRRGKYHLAADVRGGQPFKATRPFPVEVVPSALVAGPWQR